MPLKLLTCSILASYKELNVEKVQGTWDNMCISRMNEEEKAKRKAELIQQKRDVMHNAQRIPKLNDLSHPLARLFLIS